ncbi:MAG: sn-glycerol-3-phosphate ABC transporter ATP-binding protein UgpC [Ancalomicrobiaceae bacterium]|nr:sn-glycerol-3-phosphate ABC transporter ATP-binding protein UgpC [Ancalomicrobiaceae bacterium]
MATVELRRVDKTFGTHQAIQGLDLSIADGEFVALVGPSGCGKSTTLRMIAGLEGVSGGAIVIGERDVSHLPARDRDIAMVFQSYALYPHMTVAENIGFGLKLRGTRRSRIAELVDEAAETLQLKEVLGRKPKELSGGQRQRVAMGRAMVRHPQVFLFDEPLSNLDAKLRVHMRAQIKKLHRQLTTTTIYVTHDQTEAMTLADRIVVMNHGRIEQVGTPHQLYGAPVSKFVAGFIGSPEMNFLEAVVDEAAATCDLTFADGSRLSLGEAHVGLPAGRPVTLGIRPEHLHLAGPGDPQDARLSGVVEVIEPLGADTLIHVIVAGRTLVARLAAEVGDRIALGVDRTRAHLFDPASGLTL